MTQQEPDAEIVIEGPDTCIAVLICNRQHISLEQIEQAVTRTVSEPNVWPLTISAYDESDPHKHRVTLWSGTSALNRERWSDAAVQLKYQLGIRSIALSGGSLSEIL